MITYIIRVASVVPLYMWLWAVEYNNACCIVQHLTRTRQVPQIWPELKNNNISFV